MSLRNQEFGNQHFKLIVPFPKRFSFVSFLLRRAEIFTAFGNIVHAFIVARFFFGWCLQKRTLCVQWQTWFLPIAMNEQTVPWEFASYGVYVHFL